MLAISSRSRAQNGARYIAPDAGGHDDVDAGGGGHIADEIDIAAKVGCREVDDGVDAAVFRFA